ncbi:unnamed protein product [Tenebrio molitor]|nr:unnamed protein product [Tenebrio molitor]
MVTMQTATIVFKTEVADFRVPSGAIVSSTSSPSGSASMRPPPPPPPKHKSHDSKLEEPSSSIPDLVIRARRKMTVNEYKETACATANQDDMEVDPAIQPQHIADSENLLGRVLAGKGKTFRD